jgi:hypothetical protein
MRRSVIAYSGVDWAWYPARSNADGDIGRGLTNGVVVAADSFGAAPCPTARRIRKRCGRNVPWPFPIHHQALNYFAHLHRALRRVRRTCVTRWNSSQPLRLDAEAGRFIKLIGGEHIRYASVAKVASTSSNFSNSMVRRGTPSSTTMSSVEPGPCAQDQTGPGTTSGGRHASSGTRAVAPLRPGPSITRMTRHQRRGEQPFLTRSARYAR